MISTVTTQAPGFHSNETSLVEHRYYKCMLGKIGYLEIARMSPWWSVPIVWGMKLLGNDMLLAQGTPEPELLDEMRVPPESLSPELRTVLEELIAKVTPLGFENPIFYRATKSLIAGTGNSGAAVCRHRDGRIIANLIACISGGKTRKITGLLTGFTDGTLFASGDDRKELVPNPRNGVLYLPGKSAAEVFQRHESGCKKWAKDRQVRLARNEQEVATLLHDYEQSQHQWHVSRGVYQLMSSDEVEAARRQHSSAAPDAPIAELSFNLLFVDENGPVEKPAISTFSGAVAAAAIQQLVSPESNWLITFVSNSANVSLALKLDTNLALAEPGRTYGGSLKRSGSGTCADLRRRAAALLGRNDSEDLPPSVRELAVTVEFVGRMGSATDNPKLAREHVFRLSIPEVTGTFALVLNPSLYECRIVPEAGLDRSSAYSALAALLQ